MCMPNVHSTQQYILLHSKILLQYLRSPLLHIFSASAMLKGFHTFFTKHLFSFLKMLIILHKKLTL